MLIEFSIENYKSFKEKATLSMIPASIKDLDNEAIINAKRGDLLKSAVLYGANGSGKSNILNAFAKMRWMIVNSSRESQKNDPIDVESFLLHEDTKDAPSSMEVTFVINEIQYRYGFEATEEEVYTEWLFRTEKKAEKALFVRDHQDIELWKGFEEGEKLESKTRSNALFLSVVSQFNGEISQLIITWFEEVRLIHGIHDHKYFDYTAKLLGDEEYKDILIEFIQLADFGITNMELREYKRDFPGLENIIDKDQHEFLDRFKKDMGTHTDIATFHNVYNNNGKKIDDAEFSLINQESQGTQKFFNIIGAIMMALINGEIMIVDELNARLHPLLTRKIVELFNSEAGNKRGAQIIFSTHDTNLLDRELLRRDQIYFTEKDNYGASHLYSLIEYKTKPRNDEAYEKNYIKGKYGAIPFIGNIVSLLSTEEEEKSTQQE